MSHCFEQAIAFVPILGSGRHVCPRHARDPFDTEGIVHLLRRLEQSEDLDERDPLLADYQLVKTMAPVRLKRAMDIVMRTSSTERSGGALPERPF